MAKERAFMAERDTSRVAAAISPQDVPSQTDVSGTIITVANWNIWNGQNGGLEGALRAVKSLGVDFVLLAETKLMSGIYTCHFLAVQCDRNRGSHRPSGRRSFLLEEKRKL